MPVQAKSKPDPGTVMGRLKQSLEDIGAQLTGPGRGGKRRRDAIDSQVDEAEMGRRRSNQSTDDYN